MDPEEHHKMAAVEDRLWYYRALHRNVIWMLDGLPGEAVILDAGCGTGGLLRALRRAGPGWRLSGVEYSRVACELARQRCDAEVHLGTVLSLPCRDGACDAITCCDVLCQVEEPELAMWEFRRGLRPGGRLVLTLPAYPWLYSYHDRQVGNRRRYSRAMLRALLQSAGFVPERLTHFNSLPFPLVLARRKLLPPADEASDVRLAPAPVEAILRGLMALEHGWLRLGGRWSWGASLLVCARRPEA